MPTDLIFHLVQPYDEAEAVIFTEALRRGVDPLLLIAMYRNTKESDVQDWAERAAMFLRDALVQYHSNPLTTTRGPGTGLGPLRLCYNPLFVEWFGQRYGRHIGMDWPRLTLQRYQSIISEKELESEKADEP